MIDLSIYSGISKEDEEMSSSQSQATRRYEAKVGLISRSYKLKKDLVIAFKEACLRANRSQSSVLSQAMEEFIKLHPKLDSDSSFQPK